MTFNISTREEAWAFINGNKKTRIKLRINLTEEDGEDFEYLNYDPILTEGTSGQMMELYDQYIDCMPSLVEIVNLVFRDVGSDELCSDENIVEELMDNVETGLENLGYRGSELDEMIDILNDNARDMYNYFMYALIINNVVTNDKLWEFMECREAEVVNGKLYIKCRIYVEQLKDLDYMNERVDVDFVEVVDEFNKLLIASEERNLSRLVHDRQRDDRFLRGLVV